MYIRPINNVNAHVKLTSTDEDGIHCHVIDTREARGNEVCHYHQELLEQNIHEPRKQIAKTLMPLPILITGD